MTTTCQRGAGLQIIAVFKVVKALLLIVVGLGAFGLLDAATADNAERWISSIAWRWGPKAEFAIHDRFSNLHPSQLMWIGTAAFFYAVLFIVEGIGLWNAKRWAEILTIFATSSFIPFEIYELLQDLTWPRSATLAINVAVVGYLWWKIRQPRLIFAAA